MKIMDKSILLFSRVSLSIFSLEAPIFRGYEGYLYWSKNGMRQVFQNRASWQLGLTT